MSVLRIIIALYFIVLLAGCGGNDFQYKSSNDTQPGPGLFSGDDGVFNLIEKDAADTDTKKQDMDSQSPPTEKTQGAKS